MSGPSEGRKPCKGHVRAHSLSNERKPRQSSEERKPLQGNLMEGCHVRVIWGPCNH